MKLKMVKNIDFDFKDPRTLRFLIPIDGTELPNESINIMFETRENNKTEVVINLNLFDWIYVKVYRLFLKLR